MMLNNNVVKKGLKLMFKDMGYENTGMLFMYKGVIPLAIIISCLSGVLGLYCLNGLSWVIRYIIVGVGMIIVYKPIHFFLFVKASRSMGVKGYSLIFRVSYRFAKLFNLDSNALSLLYMLSGKRYNINYEPKDDLEGQILNYIIALSYMSSEFKSHLNVNLDVFLNVNFDKLKGFSMELDNVVSLIEQEKKSLLNRMKMYGYV